MISSAICFLSCKKVKCTICCTKEQNSKAHSHQHLTQYIGLILIYVSVCNIHIICVQILFCICFSIYCVVKNLRDNLFSFAFLIFEDKYELWPWLFKKWSSKVWLWNLLFCFKAFRSCFFKFIPYCCCLVLVVVYISFYTGC